MGSRGLKASEGQGHTANLWLRWAVTPSSSAVSPQGLGPTHGDTFVVTCACHLHLMDKSPADFTVHLRFACLFLPFLPLSLKTDRDSPGLSSSLTLKPLRIYQFL